MDDGRVVTGLRERRTPLIPAILINRATWSRPVFQPSRRIACHSLCTVHPIIFLENPTHLTNQNLVTQGSATWRALLDQTIATRSNKPTSHVFVQDPANTLDRETIMILVNKRNYLIPGWSSSLVKKAEASLRISLARRSSAFSRLRRLISSCSSRVTPGC